MSPSKRRRLGITTKERDAAPDEETATSETPAADSAEASADTPAETTVPSPGVPAVREDQEDDLLSNLGGGRPAVVDPLEPQLIDRTKLPSAPEERLAVYEAAIETAQGTLAHTVTKAKFRAEIEIGFVLDAIREEELHLAKYGSIENYGEQRWGYKRSTLYELMDTAAIRLAAASGRVVSGNPDTKRRKALAPPAPRPALESAPAGTEADGTEQQAGEAPETPPVPALVKAELSKSVALELVPTWREEGEEAALAKLAEAQQKAQQNGRKLTAGLVREVVKDSGSARKSEVKDKGKQGTDNLAPSERERREAVNKTLTDAAAAAEKLITALDKLDMDSTPPLDHAAAERDAKAIRAAGRWLNTKVKVPAEVVDAELVHD
ncbi:hypothetical protein QQY66_49185 [Streptomyces sp. DG2A-72]|uniref:hypothetical protein n=1 Tax=Streptomyces sp. DG2A-72 TaxID=3051386 RepID=UPI00265BDC67|nr:hypothetical protein [Streptomyces sp. DG2A-72]MDO0939289.1 hypothetical protein [Streptomyces sp. DG2A-72]